MPSKLNRTDRRACGAGLAALEVARLASLNLRTTAAKLCGNPDWGRNIGSNPAERSEALLKFTAECYALAAASIYVINLLSAV